MKGKPIAAAVVAGTLIGYSRFLRPWHERWGATDEEVAAALPGDELIGKAAGQVTRAITIDAPPEAVWAWLVQLGAERGGFYSYDRLEDLFGLGIHSANAIATEWQSRAVGDRVFGDSKGRGRLVRHGGDTEPRSGSADGQLQDGTSGEVHGGSSDGIRVGLRSR
jgi:hypothetical protein